ncbi:hypothetical protein BH23GEM2_BH23GEM2_15850 [soil metagenome]
MRCPLAIASATLLAACYAPAEFRLDTPVVATVTPELSRGRYEQYRVELRAAGEIVTGRLLRPRDAVGALPAVLLNNGRELNSEAVRYLPPEFGDVVVLSLDFPEAIPYELTMRGFLFRNTQIRQELRRIPRFFSIGGAYLAQRSDVDSSRLTMAMTSFAVPFGVIAAARDERFRNVGLIYGAGNLASVFEANLDLRPRFLRPVASWLVMQVYGEFEPTQFVAGIAPRPLVMVNGRGDPQMPVEAVQALYDAAREPKTLIWLQTGHVQPGDTQLVRALVDTMLDRLPALHIAPGTVPQ